MTPLEVGKVHAALAHALLNVWPVCPKTQRILHAELDLWSNDQRSMASSDEYLEWLTQRVTTGGIEAAAVTALGQAKNDFQRIDEHLQLIFDKSSELTRERYLACTDWALGDAKLEVEAVNIPRYPDPIGFGELGTAACVAPRRGEAPTEVKITLIPSLLGPPSWAAVPYLLCHELVCHVNQAAPMDSGDPFAEGWMDLVAKHLHDQWVDRIFPWAPAMARSAASRLSDIVLRRWPGLAEPHMSTRAARVQGRYAAEWAERHLGSPRDMPERAANLTCLSLQLNRTRSTVADRKAFVAKVNHASLDPALQARFLATLNRWLNSQATAAEVLFFT